MNCANVKRNAAAHFFTLGDTLMKQTLSQFWLSAPRDPRESHRPRYESSWPALAELTEGHHRDEEPQAFPDWMLERAERLRDLCQYQSQESLSLIHI